VFNFERNSWIWFSSIEIFGSFDIISIDDIIILHFINHILWNGRKHLVKNFVFINNLDIDRSIRMCWLFHFFMFIIDNFKKYLFGKKSTNFEFYIIIITNFIYSNDHNFDNLPVDKCIFIYQKLHKIEKFSIWNLSRIFCEGY